MHRRAEDKLDDQVAQVFGEVGSLVLVVAIAMAVGWSIGVWLAYL